EQVWAALAQSALHSASTREGSTFAAADEFSSVVAGETSGWLAPRSPASGAGSDETGACVVRGPSGSAMLGAGDGVRGSPGVPAPHPRTTPNDPTTTPARQSACGFAMSGR